MKLNKNLNKDRDEYTRFLGNFRGVDFSSDPSTVAEYRLAECVNMYKDYRSGQGQAIETIPGFRLAHNFNSQIYGIHRYTNGDEITVLVHAGKYLYQCKKPDFKHDELWVNVALKKEDANYVQCMNEAKSTSFMFNNRLYILDGQHFYYYDGYMIYNIIDSAFVPTTHISLAPDGGEIPQSAYSGEYSQQNILTDRYKSTFVADGVSNTFSVPLGLDDNTSFSSSAKVEYTDAENNSSFVYEADFSKYPTMVEVYQYGVQLPWADENGNVPYKIIERSNPFNITTDDEIQAYPNAIKSISEEGVITLVNDPPRPENNSCILDETSPFGFSYNGIKAAYPTGYAGIEIVASKRVTTIKGVTTKDEDVGSIITNCTIAAVFDGRVFLSGNPEYPNFVFYNGINPETGFSDPSYFGILNYFSEGVTNTPITAMMPITDTLMILRKDTIQDGAVTFRSRIETGNDVQPVIYEGNAGLPGVGCLGAYCNFKDDPIFISRYGVDAVGKYTNAKYERAIEHRSSLIDGMLLNLDLSKACITEFEGYMWLLVEGKIFLADSRQTYTHESGVMQYEWFYLDDIGIYEGQKEAYVYAELPKKLPENLTGTWIGGKLYDITSADKISSEAIGNVPKLGDEVDKDTTISGVSSGGHTVYFVKYTERLIDGTTTIKPLYVETSPYKFGGTFKPATMIMAVDSERLVFAANEYLCCFNFDKRDPEDDYKIPTDEYTFNDRRIMSGLATKMDDCGIPHLVKNTVKKSMVVKMRTFPTSAAKVKVRTNRQPMREVERLIGGRFGITKDFNLADLTYETGEKNIFRVREKEKKWLEKQIYLISDEFKKPFALHHIVYSYEIAGRYKD